MFKADTWPTYGDDDSPDQAKHPRAERRHRDIGIVSVSDGGTDFGIWRVVL